MALTDKYVHFDFNGCSRRVPLRVILHNRAKLKARIEGLPFEETLASSAEIFERSDGLIANWVNLMAWEELEPFLEEVPPPPPPTDLKFQFNHGDCRLRVVGPEVLG